MAQLVKIKGTLVLEVKLSSPADKARSIFENNWKIFPEIMPLGIKSVKYDNSGMRCWTFVNDDCGIWKDKPGYDNAGNLTWTLKEGKVPLSFYESLNVTYQFKEDGQGCLATATLEFDKKSVHVDPQDYMNFIREMLKAVDQDPQPAGK